MGNDSSKKTSYEIEMKKSKDTRVNIDKLKKRKTNKKHVGKIRTKRSKCWKFGFSLLVTTFIINVVIAISMWCTNIYYDSIYKILTFHENGTIFELWADPSVARMISVHLFNYTNYEAVQEGTQVPHVQQLGPYVYREYVKRVFVEFHGDGTLTYQENRTHEFALELSNGSMSDDIVLPNFPVLAAHNLDNSNILERGGVSLLKFATFPEDFLKVKVQEIIWGYDDRFTLVTRTLKAGLDVLTKANESKKRFGILAARAGLSMDKVTIGTGIPDVDNFATVIRYNGKSTIGAWDTEECDRINGTDGSVYPRRVVKWNSTIQVFSKELCRNVPMVYEKDVKTSDGIPAYRYSMADDIFSFEKNSTNNKCYCKHSNCPPSGTINASPCHSRLPLYFSYPHFTHGDPVLREKVTGLTPDPEKYKTLVDIHEMGITVNGVSRLQVNFYIDKSSNTPWLKINDGTVLPFGWVELKMGKLTSFLKILLLLATYLVPILEYLLSYGSLLIVFTFPFLICYMLKHCKYKELTLQ